MGYGVRIRKVLDESLPTSRRHLSLREAVTDYCPLGYTATGAYLTAEARPDGEFKYDPARGGGPSGQPSSPAGGDAGLRGPMYINRAGYLVSEERAEALELPAPITRNLFAEL